MRIFSYFYDIALRWAGHRHAPYYLGGLSFAESSFFPIPPDVMLAPMALARRNRAWIYALITTVASVLGGVLGYLIGMYGLEAVEPVLQNHGYWDKYLTAQEWFEKWGFWAVFIAGFSPIPYKVFTISAGAAAMSLLPFVVASLIGRGARFFLVAGLIWWGGERMEKSIRTNVDRIGWLLIVVIIIAYFFLRG